MPDCQSFRREIDCLDEVFEFLGAFISGNHLDGRIEFAINFVVEELFTNMVKYNTGSSADIEIRIDRNGSGIKIELIDKDVDPFDPEGLEDVDTSRGADERVPGGLGIHLVKSMVDQITYAYSNRVMTVTVLKALES